MSGEILSWGWATGIYWVEATYAAKKTRLRPIQGHLTPTLLGLPTPQYNSSSKGIMDKKLYELSNISENKGGLADKRRQPI